MAIGPGLIRLAMTENYKYTSKNNPLILNKNKIIMKSKSCWRSCGKSNIDSKSLI